MELKNHKRQKIGERVDWDPDKVALLESVRKNLGDRWTDDFGKSDASDTEKRVQEMIKEGGSHCNWLLLGIKEI